MGATATDKKKFLASVVRDPGGLYFEYSLG